jgi:hypothetical protein
MVYTYKLYDCHIKNTMAHGTSAHLALEIGGDFLQLPGELAPGFQQRSGDFWV